MRELSKVPKAFKSFMAAMVLVFVLLTLWFFLKEEPEYMKQYNIPEVKKCIDGFDKLPPEDCMLRVKVGDLNLEFPMLYGVSLHHTIIGKSIHLQRYSPANKKLAPYVNAQSIGAEFIATDRFYFSGHNIDYIATTDKKYSSFKKIPTKPFGSKFWISYFSIQYENEANWAHYMNTHQLVDAFQACQNNQPIAGNYFILRNEDLTMSPMRLRYSLKQVGEKRCGIQIAFRIQDNVYFQFDVFIPAKGTTETGWTNEDWKSLLASIDAFVESVMIEDIALIKAP